MTYTPVHNRFWSDGWVRSLNALDRYLFLYLLTNGRARMNGIYELPLDLMASESGIDEKDLRMSMLPRLEPKIYYREGWVIIVNYLNHHLNGGPKYDIGVKKDFDLLPKKIQELARSYGYSIDTLSKGISVSRSIVKNSKEENTEIAKAISTPYSLEVKEVKIDSEGQERSQKKKKESDPAWPFFQEAMGMLTKHAGIPLLSTGKDLIRLKEAMKSLKNKDILGLVESEIESGWANRVGYSLAAILTNNRINKYKSDWNV